METDETGPSYMSSASTPFNKHNIKEDFNYHNFASRTPYSTYNNPPKYFDYIAKGAERPLDGMFKTKFNNFNKSLLGTSLKYISQHQGVLVVNSY